jgi:hypothetical protein
MGALATEAACPGAGGRPLWPRRQPALELEEGRSDSGGKPPRPRRKAVRATEEGRPRPGGKPSCTRNDEDLGPAVGSPPFVCEQILKKLVSVHRRTQVKLHQDPDHPHSWSRTLLLLVQSGFPTGQDKLPGQDDLVSRYSFSKVSSLPSVRSGLRPFSHPAL